MYHMQVSYSIFPYHEFVRASIFNIQIHQKPVPDKEVRFIRIKTQTNQSQHLAPQAWILWTKKQAKQI